MKKLVKLTEEWRDIKGFEGSYQVSNLGRVKSLPRKVGDRTIKERYLSCTPNGAGYKQVFLYKDGIRIFHLVHVLVAVHFLNHKPNGMKIVCDHKDNNKLNNYVTNLQLVTHRENLSRRGGTSQFTGVYWYKQTKQWRARITVGGVVYSLGMYEDEQEAANAYITALEGFNFNLKTLSLCL